MSYYGGFYDLIVVGAGHAGCEAALAGARTGVNTLLLTLNLDQVALMPCNPAIGGPAKSHIVHEIDALGGEMGRNIDHTAIQYRMLNTAKGPAVHALRAQADKIRYQTRMKSVLEQEQHLWLKQGVVNGLLCKNGRMQGVSTQNGIYYHCHCVVITSGTYLSGKVLVGEINYPGGPNSQLAVSGLSEDLERKGIQLQRFKTDTPPRLLGRTLDFDQMEAQPGHESPGRFSFYDQGMSLPQVSCYLTFTTEKTHQIIEDNLSRAPMYAGIMDGPGPRYCPSIEDKIARFPEKSRHQLFVEPEGLDTDEYYLQGMTTGLPVDVQERVVSSIPGLQNAAITRYGYAIEYDCIDPTQLDQTLECKLVKGLYFAGQINGTSGYEEAAGQGILAGINASLKIRGQDQVIIKRSEGYIGVLVDDLVTKGTDEPYRMLTSRAEYRLILRQDNADLRLTELGYKVGLVKDNIYKQFKEKEEAIEREKARLKKVKLTPNEKVQEFMTQQGTSPLKKPMPLYDLLKRPELSYESLVAFDPERPELERDVTRQIEIQIKYEGYIKKQMEQIARFEKLEDKKIPADINFDRIFGISSEAKEKLRKYQPRSVGQASRISGVNPSDISVLMVHLESRRRTGSRAYAEEHNKNGE